MAIGVSWRGNGSPDTNPDHDPVCVHRLGVQPEHPVQTAFVVAKVLAPLHLPARLTVLPLAGCAASDDLEGRKAEELRIFQQPADTAVDRIQTCTGTWVQADGHPE
jgi:hypothetical protein